MCGRFTQLLIWRQIHDLYNLKGPPLLLNLQLRYNRCTGAGFCGMPAQCGREPRYRPTPLGTGVILGTRR